jgi:carbon monoxide dehydrogenase subunit G
MAIDVAAETVIMRPRSEVAAFVMDPANDQTWIKAFSSVEPLTDPPTAVGSQVKRVAGFMGRRIVYVMEVVELEPESRLVMKTVEGPFPMTVHYEFEPLGSEGESGTLVRVRNQGGSDGFMAAFGPLMGWMVNRQVKKDLALLRSVLEEG